MFTKFPSFVVFPLLLLAALPQAVSAQTGEDNVVRNATSVLNEIMGIPASRIPESMLANAQGLAIIPSVVKVGLIGGVRHGKGVVVIRDDTGAWQAPSFVSLTGGSIGWQVGVQSTDVILVFRTRKSVDNLKNGKFTIGVDAAAAAGPVGRQAAAATDAQLRAEILSYSRSRGLFAGVSLDGSALQIDNQSNSLFYYPHGPGSTAVVPESAITLVSTIAQLTVPAAAAAGPVAGGAPAATPVTLAPTPAAAPAAQSSTDLLRYRLAESAVRLNALLDEDWQQFLALPTEIFSGNQPAPATELVDALAHYDRIADDPDYRILAVRPEFQTTHELLKKYVATALQSGSGTLDLPPPPSPASGQSKVNTRRRY